MSNPGSHINRVLASFSLACLAACATSGASGPELSAGDAAIRVGELRDHVAALTSEAMEGRATGSIGEKRAADYIARAFERAATMSSVTRADR